MEILSKILRIKFYHPDRQQKCKRKRDAVEFEDHRKSSIGSDTLYLLKPDNPIRFALKTE
jgi:hypothetical protein